jgi:hypothetical protein
MANTNPTDRQASDTSSPAAEDAKDQGAVLGLILAEHPAQITVPEVIREQTGDSDEFGEKDSVERAMRDLVGVGLLHRQGIFVLPTRAALRFEQIQAVG